MRTIRLIHWNDNEAHERASLLRMKGFRIIHNGIKGQQDLRELRRSQPFVVVIDLTRLPSQGRDIGMYLRQSKSTRNIPLIFVEGEKEKVDRIKKLLPDAHFTSWPNIHGVLRKALLHPVKNPVLPQSIFDAYRGVSLPKKLGIVENTVIALIDPPKGFEKILGQLPHGVKIHRKLENENTLALWFVRSQSDLKRKIRNVSNHSTKSPVWIIWPKKDSGISSDLSQVVVRRIGLASGLVDYKICAVDTTWSGLLFTSRDKPK